MNFDSYYQPPEPLFESEEILHCESCECETDHLLICWTRGTVEAECAVCGYITDLDNEEECS